MPKITVTDEGTSLVLEHAKIAEIVNTGESTCYYGFEKNIVAEDDENQGIPLTPGTNKFLSGAGVANRAVRLICADGESTVIHYSIGG